MPVQLRRKFGNLLCCENHHLFGFDLGRTLDGTHVSEHEAVLLSLAERLAEDAMSVADRARTHPALPVRFAVAALAAFGEQGAVPYLDVLGAELLQEL